METKNIRVIDIDGIDNRDYPDYVDAYISAAEWKDTGCSLSEKELDELNEEHVDFVYEEVINYLN